MVTTKRAKLYKRLFFVDIMNKEETEKINKAGKIAAQAVAYARSIVKKDILLLELADKIEVKIIELGGKPAFPVNLSMNEIAAHYTPSFDDSSKAAGLLKIDLGVHVDGYAADTAFSVDLENNEENKKLILSAESALKLALDNFNKNISFRSVGKEIEKEIVKNGFSPVYNLSGHSIDRYDLHAGVNVPNYDDGNDDKITEGLYAIEPFSTNGSGKVRDGRASGIYQLIKDGSVRDMFARQVLLFIAEEYATLPFCSRWIYKQFGSRGLIALKQIEQAGLLHNFAQLIEIAGGKVAQAEHSVFITKDGKTITTALNNL